jgi:putative tricarboxylic transport membrane protein
MPQDHISIRNLLAAIRFVRGFLAATALSLLGATTTSAQEWSPSRPIDIIVSSGAGGAADREAREAQKFLSALPGMPPVAVTNRQGGSGSVAWSSVLQRAGDAHVIATLNVALLTNQILGSSKISHRDLTPLAVLMREYVALWTREASPIASTADLIARLKRNPASVSFGLSPGLGNQNHIVLGMIAKAAGIDPKSLKIVVFSSGGQGMTAALGGHVDVWAGTLGGALQHSRKGSVRVLGVSAPERQSGDSAALPTFREQGVDAVYAAYRGFLGPGGLTAAQRAFWDQSFSTIVQSAEWKQAEVRNAWGSGYLDSTATARFLDVEFENLRKILAELGVTK